jgi:hypothetical protein
MLRKFSKSRSRLVEVRGPSQQTRVMSHEDYVSKTIEEKRNEVELFRAGLSFRGNSDHRGEQIMRRWIA